jgi:hypothetical protein
MHVEALQYTEINVRESPWLPIVYLETLHQGLSIYKIDSF